MFLTEDELRVFTGRKTTQAQSKQLNKYGIRYVVSASNKVIVLRESIFEHLTKRERDYELNIAWLNNAKTKTK